MTPFEPIKTLKPIWWVGVNGVNGFRCTNNFLRHSDIEKPTLILSVGKAAQQMYLATAEHFGSGIPYFAATRREHIQQLNGQNILCAGLEWVDQ